MPTQWTHRILIGVVAAALFAVPVAMLVAPERADGQMTLMQRLPAFSKFQCALCHTSSAPTASAFTLNGFGIDFEANGNVWNEALALKNSDGDRCSNGFELGDVDGDGVYDQGGDPVENSNPGVADCTLPVTKATWGFIKEIFSKEMPQ